MFTSWSPTVRAHVLTDLALEVADERAAVVLDDGRQVRSGELSVRHPARELVVPHAVVSAEELPVRLREVRDLLPARERERPARRLRRVPLHAVRGRDLAKLLVVVEDRGVCGVRELAVVRRGAEVELAGRLRESVEAGAGRSGSGRGRAGRTCWSRLRSRYWGTRCLQARHIN